MHSDWRLFSSRALCCRSVHWRQKKVVYLAFCLLSDLGSSACDVNLTKCICMKKAALFSIGFLLSFCRAMLILVIWIRMAHTMCTLRNVVQQWFEMHRRIYRQIVLRRGQTITAFEYCFHNPTYPFHLNNSHSDSQFSSSPYQAMKLRNRLILFLVCFRSFDKIWLSNHNLCLI